MNSRRPAEWWKDKEHTKSDCVRNTDYGLEVDCTCPEECTVCFGDKSREGPHG